jgi:hypothetical protein
MNIRLSKQKLQRLSDLEKSATPENWFALDATKETKKIEDAILIVELRNNAKSLIEMSKELLHAEEWYAFRLQMLREFCESKGYLTEYCNIVANGKEDVSSPRTYVDLIQIAKHERDKAVEAAKKTAKNMEEMERDLYLKLIDKEKELENLKDLLRDLTEELPDDSKFHQRIKNILEKE